MHRSDLDMQERASSLAAAGTSSSVSAAAGNSGAATWEWTTPFSNLLQEYESLVQRCRQRFGPERSGANTGPRPGTSSAPGGSSLLSSRPAVGRAASQTGLPTVSSESSNSVPEQGASGVSASADRANLTSRVSMIPSRRECGIYID